MISLIIPGAPIGKGRPKFARAGAFVRVYTPDKTRLEEAFIRMVFNEKYPGHVPIPGAIRMDIRAYMPIPKSTSKKLRERMALENVPHVKKPDRSNITKLAEDALNEMAYIDDCQIYAGDTWKYYSPRPRLEIDIFEENEYTAVKVP